MLGCVLVDDEWLVLGCVVHGAGCCVQLCVGEVEVQPGVDCVDEFEGGLGCWDFDLVLVLVLREEWDGCCEEPAEYCVWE